MAEAELEQARADERASGNEGQFFSLIYNEQHAPAAEWFGNHGWQPESVSLIDYFHEIDRPIPAPGSEAGQMFADIRLVNAVKG